MSATPCTPERGEGWCGETWPVSVPGSPFHVRFHRCRLVVEHGGTGDAVPCSCACGAVLPVAEPEPEPERRSVLLLEYRCPKCGLVTHQLDSVCEVLHRCPVSGALQRLKVVG